MFANTVFTRVSARSTQLILDSQRGGAYSREALFGGKRSLSTSKRHQNTFN